MPNPSKFIYAAALALTVASDIKERLDAKKAAKLYLASHKEFEEIQRANEAQISYLCHMLDEHDIAVDEFDLIALNFNQ